MHKDLSQIEFYFPSGEFKDKTAIVNAIISLIKNRGSINHSGYSDSELLRQGLLDHIGNGNVEQYKEISNEQKLEIEKVISETIKKCNDKLSVPTKNFVFVHPYFTTKEDKVFEGVMAMAVYSCVFHLFINLDEYTKKSLENTVAHELNHTIYYYHHYDNFNDYTLLDEMLLEGLAENFREQYFNSEITKWAGALEKEEAFQILKNLDKHTLESRDQKVIKEFLFGNNKYKRWNGYSIGYWLVKKFVNKNKYLSWNELMKTNPKKFIEIIK